MHFVELFATRLIIHLISQVSSAGDCLITIRSAQVLIFCAGIRTGFPVLKSQITSLYLVLHSLKYGHGQINCWFVNGKFERP